MAIFKALAYVSFYIKVYPSRAICRKNAVRNTWHYRPIFWTIVSAVVLHEHEMPISITTDGGLVLWFFLDNPWNCMAHNNCLSPLELVQTQSSFDRKVNNAGGLVSEQPSKTFQENKTVSLRFLKNLLLGNYCQTIFFLKSKFRLISKNTVPTKCKIVFDVGVLT